ncbi:MAG TPA: CU044_2847 family protein [Anaerolineae bacterium]
MLFHLLQEGGNLIVEVDEPAPEGGVVKAARPGEIAEKAEETREDALSKIKPAAQSIIAQLRGLHDEPDEIGVEFGIKLSAAAGAFIASAGVEANYKMTLKWAKK